METNQLIVSSSSGDADPHRDPDDSVSQSAADEVSFGFNQLQIDANEDNNPKKLTPESAETDDEEQKEPEQEEEEEVVEDNDDDDDFTFVCAGDSGSPTTEVFDDGQIRTVFPLFDQSLLLGVDSDDGKRRLPIDVPVDNVFIESPRRFPAEYGETHGTVLALPKELDSGTQEINMKSNSTGFSKLWRFRNEMNRSNSDGRDAFVFLDRSDTATTSEPKQKATAVSVAGGGPTAGGKGKGVKKGSKVKKSTPSSHEVYLKQKGGQSEEERRRSYLPYRPGLMGFFTNVNGGLSKNVHPF